MSAAATAAGYLYASGRLRGRGSRDSAAEAEQQPETEQRPPVRRREVRVAVMPARSECVKPAARPRTPTIQYRTRRWRPNE